MLPTNAQQCLKTLNLLFVCPQNGSLSRTQSMPPRGPRPFAVRGAAQILRFILNLFFSNSFLEIQVFRSVFLFNVDQFLTVYSP